MAKTIRKVGVIGAGVMGCGIAAHLTNAGIPVRLLDILPRELPEGAGRAARNGVANAAVQTALKSKPAVFFHKSCAQMIETGNLEDDLESLSDCDLVIEAIIERLDIKKSLFERLQGVLQEGTIVASNTSGLRIADMLEGRSDTFKQHFLVMHFFNPVRYMKLLEIVTGEETKPEVLQTVQHFGREVLGKGIVMGKDTPNFVGNRIGVHSMLYTMHHMLEQKLSPEDVDVITGQAMAHPKSASFRTGDLVGLDTLIHVADHCYEALADDEERDVFKAPDYVRNMVERKQLGNKTRGGFYKKTKSGIEVLDPYTGEYREKGGDEEIRKTAKKIAKMSNPADRIKALANADGKTGEFAWNVLSRSLAYTARRVGEIADTVWAIDDAMRWGYNWDLGPFQKWDALGFRETVERMKSDGVKLPASIQAMYDAGAESFYKDGKVYDLIKNEYVDLPSDPREAKLTVLRKSDSPVLKNDGAAAWDIGDGILCVRFGTKANSIDGDVISLLDQAVDRAEKDFSGLLISNEGEHFCVGANLFMIVMAANQKQWSQISDVVDGMHKTMQKMKYSQVPVVAAPYGMTLGGGMEVSIASNACQAAAETYIGLVEVGVGLIPGGAGTKNMLWRALESIPEGVEASVEHYVTQVFKNIALAKVATSAVEAKRFGYLRHHDGVSFDKARHLHEAKQFALGLASSGWHPPTQRAYRLPGESGIATLRMMVDTLVAGGHASEHDALIAGRLANVLCGGVSGASAPVTEERMLELEREAFLSLCGEQKSLERMQYMLQNNKPLRN